jgi:hypothetical protein
MLHIMKARCAHPDCNARVSIVTPECKCKNKYCSIHRGHMDHACVFDYRDENLKHMMKTMSTPIVGKKLESL